ncbi:MAG: hypothetical protein NVSMB2_12680 [Chloroflexota bacterium]
MRTWIERTTSADPQMVLTLAARVEDWPRLLPHYRSVRVLANDENGERVVEMRARRDLVGRLGIPLWWVARQRILSDRVEFVHVRGVTRGMDVAWTWSTAADGRTAIRIAHDFAPDWALPDGLVHVVLGEFFVNSVARRTLSRLCRVAEVHEQPPSSAT